MLMHNFLLSSVVVYIYTFLYNAYAMNIHNVSSWLVVFFSFFFSYFLFSKKTLIKHIFNEKRFNSNNKNNISYTEEDIQRKRHVDIYIYVNMYIHRYV